MLAFTYGEIQLHHGVECDSRQSFINVQELQQLVFIINDLLNTFLWNVPCDENNFQ